MAKGGNQTPYFEGQTTMAKGGNQTPYFEGQTTMTKGGNQTPYFEEGQTIQWPKGVIRQRILKDRQYNGQRG